MKILAIIRFLISEVYFLMRYLQLRLEMAEKRLENSGKEEGVKAQHWEAKYQQNQAEMKKQKAWVLFFMGIKYFRF